MDILVVIEFFCIYKVLDVIFFLKRKDLIILILIEVDGLLVLGLSEGILDVEGFGEELN